MKYRKKVKLEKNIKQNILDDWWKLKCQEKFFRVSVDSRWNPATVGSHGKI